MRRVSRIASIAMLWLFCLGCNPEIEVYAPEKELYIIYGVLNPDQNEQFVSITKIFQTESDALLYASENDLTARGLNVELRSDTNSWQAQLIDVPSEPSELFAKSTGVYRFETSGNQKLIAGNSYDLRITKPGVDTFLITSNTIIPIRPDLTSPGTPIYSQQLGVYTFPTMDFDEDQLIYFNMGGGYGFELRLMVAYKEGNENKLAQWGPTPVFTEPVRCISGTNRGVMCYEIAANTVPNTLKRYFSKAQDTIILDDTIRVAHSVNDLSRSIWMEVTALDTAMTAYLKSNNPFGYGLNLLQDRKEVDNISGANFGLFGSISTSRKYIFLGSCTRYLASIQAYRPSGCGN